MNARTALAALYVAAIVAIVYLLSTVPDPRTAAKQAPRPEPHTCTAPEGWTGKIERTESPYGSGWACVLRKGTTVKAFYY